MARARGDAFMRVFAPAFLNGLEGQTDKCSKLHSHLDGLDPGGNVAGAPAHAGNANALRESQLAYTNRASMVKSIIVKHITAPTVKQVIDAACEAVVA
eukprot:CAMPEP_0183376236 /NCGR_PEP_ID=MMETSP0164_2-20130417/119703_1 /TAXON_ID=221442 /ORGANISM="Coccolithus pelagicus ssp braarudi, Strain PLY182g" /LENGTH=97 /DNA_ID=CAMNT_0025553515 /DNA_START=143 /DNA_END=434 /DNA_ORIENTATION=-